MAIYDALIGDLIIQTDLTKQEVKDLFDINGMQFNLMRDGDLFMDVYWITEVQPDEPITHELASEWDRVVKEFRRRLCK